MAYPPPPGWVNPALPPPSGPAAEPATIPQRWGAEMIDGVLVLIVYFAADAVWGYLLWFLQSAVVQGSTGYTLGRVVTKTRLVDAETLGPIGVIRQVSRGLAFLIVFWLTLGIGTLISMWRDPRGQSIADRAFKAMVIATG